MAKITNNAVGARVVNAVSGGRVVQIALKAGETRELDLLETKPTVARASSGEFKISGAFTDAPKVEASSANTSGEKVAAEWLSRVQTEMKAKDDEIARLRKQVEAGSAGEGQSGQKPSQGRPRVQETPETRAAVVIPDNWQELSWPERRSLASQLSDTPIANGDDATAAIEAELNRRAS